MSAPKFEVGDRIVIAWRGHFPHDDLIVSDGRGGLARIKLPLKATVRVARRQGSDERDPTGGCGQWLYLADLDKGPVGYDGWFDETEIVFLNPVDTLGEIR